MPVVVSGRFLPLKIPTDETVSLQQDVLVLYVGPLDKYSDSPGADKMNLDTRSRKCLLEVRAQRLVEVLWSVALFICHIISQLMRDNITNITTSLQWDLFVIALVHEAHLGTHHASRPATLH